MNLSLPISSARRNIITALVMVLVGIAFGLIAQRLENLPMRWSGAVLVCFAIFLMVVISGKIRSIFLSLLILSILLSFNYHITYRPHIGISDGIAIGGINLCLIILVLIWIHEIRDGKNQIDFFPATTIPILVMLIVAVLSLWNSSDRVLSLYGIVSYVEALIFYFYCANNLKSKKDLKLALLTLQLCMLIQGGICILETATNTNFITSFKVFGKEPYSTVFRPGGLTGGPTYAGGYLAALLPLVFVQFFIFKNKMGKILTFLTSMIGITGLVLTLTRGAWLAAAIASIPTMLLLLRHRFVRIRHIAMVIMLIVAMLVVFRGRVFLRFSEGPQNLRNRVHLLQTAANMVKAYPIAGIGLNTFHTEMQRYVPPHLAYEWIYLVHNKYMLVWSETGTLGLISFLWLFASALRRAFRLSHSRDLLLSATSIGLFGSLVIIGIHMHFESYSGGAALNQFWLSIAMVAGLREIQKAYADEDLITPMRT